MNRRKSKRENERKSSRRQQKTMDKVFSILRERSMESLERAREQLLAMNIENPEAQEALEYYTENWYDITHPGIVSLLCEAVGGKQSEVVPLQVVMLMLSAASDIHDDIIDRSTSKNNRPTVFGKFGQDIAVLIGDAILVKSFVYLYENIQQFSRKKRKAIVDTIHDNFFRAWNAQLLENQSKGDMEIPLKRYLRIIKEKASIIEANTIVGAILGGGAQKKNDESVAIYGRNLGILIFLREEFIDIFEPRELRNRMNDGILPLPLLCAFGKSRTKKEVSRIILKNEISQEEMEEIINCTFQNESVKRLIRFMKKLGNEASKVITRITRNRKLKEDLQLLIDGSLENL